MHNKYNQVKDYSKIPELCPIPNLLDIQKNSFEDFLQRFIPSDKRKMQGLQEVFINIFPVQDFTGNLILDFISYSLGECKDSAYGCWEKGGTYSAPLEVKINLISKKTGEIKEQD
ncbi:unnamed protein product, partial [marine sediment metagenome]